jgi:hypothetical protein
MINIHTRINSITGIVLGIGRDRYVRQADVCNYNDKNTKECGMIMLLRKAAIYSKTKERKSYDEKEGSVVGEDGPDTDRMGFSQEHSIAILAGF